MSQNTSVWLPLNQTTEQWAWVDRTTRVVVLESLGPSREYVQAYAGRLGGLRAMTGVAMRVHVRIVEAPPEPAPPTPTPTPTPAKKAAAKKAAGKKTNGPATARQQAATFAKRVRAGMLEHRMTDSDLALAAFGSRDFPIGRYLRGTSPVDPEAAQRIASALGLRREDLLP